MKCTMQWCEKLNAYVAKQHVRCKHGELQFHASKSPSKYTPKSWDNPIGTVWANDSHSMKRLQSKLESKSMGRWVGGRSFLACACIVPWHALSPVLNLFTDHANSGYSPTICYFTWTMSAIAGSSPLPGCVRIPDTIRESIQELNPCHYCVQERIRTGD